MQAAPLNSRAVARRAIAIAWLANVLAAALIGIGYFGDALSGAGPFVRIWSAAALVSTLALLFLVAALPLFVLAALNVRERVLGWVQAAWWTLALLVVFVDTRIYALFRYHFNGMVWNLLTTPGGEDNYEIGASTWIAVGLATVVVFLVERGAWPRVVALATRQARWIRVAVVVVIAIIAFEKLTFAVADARHDRSITARSALFPAYQRLKMKRTLAHFFDVDVRPEPTLDVGSPGVLLHYPRTMPVVPQGRAQPNVLVIVIDSLRADMLGPETMPRIHEWSKRARVFADHASGGNATRFGIFALVYGIHGSYWMPVYEENAPPVLVTALDRAGYDMRVLSAARMSFPEFRSTAWVGMNDRVEDAFPEAEKFERDRAVAARFDAWLAERESRGASAPFFCFTLLDAPHQTYSWPPEETVFEPAPRALDYLDLARRPDDATVAAVRNSYKNAVRFSDTTAARMIDALERRGLLANTFVLVTGDHGEEFFENGYFGHTSNFTPEQVHVTCVLGGPGVEPGVETRPTCHVDFAPTILEALGVAPALRAEWSQGENLLAPLALRDRIVAGWHEVAVWADGGILYVPLEGYRGQVEARDERWRPLADERGFIAAHAATIGELARTFRYFLR